jgi:tetratricopeptide (TPR) repeat protein
MAGLLFAIHPLNVESVAWISQRKNTLAMLFYLLSALSLLRWHREPGPASLGLATGLFAASLLSKPIAVMFPVVILLYAWWRRPADARRLVAASLPFFALAALCGVMTVAFQQAHSIQGEAVGPAGMRGRLLVAARALTFYVQKALWPSGLCAVYPRWTPDGLWKPGLLSAALLLSAAAALFVRRDSGAERAGLFALGYYALMLFPVLGFLDVGFMFYASAADHWAYAALPALFAAAGAAADGVRRSIRPPPLRLAATAGASVLAAALAAASYRQAGVYRGMGTLFSHTVARNPRAWVAHAWLGNLALDDGRLDAAEEHYLLALRCRPDYWEAQNGLGIVFARRGNLDVAAELFRAVLDRKPEHASARRNLRLAMAQKSAGALRGRGLPLPGAAARADPGPQQAQ